jgi:hypothetical protein
MQERWRWLFEPWDHKTALVFAIGVVGVILVLNMVF